MALSGRGADRSGRHARGSEHAQTSLGIARFAPHLQRYCHAISRHWRVLHQPARRHVNLFVQLAGSKCQEDVAWPDQGVRFFRNNVQFVSEFWRVYSDVVEACFTKSVRGSWKDLLRANSLRDELATCKECGHLT